MRILIFNSVFYPLKYGGAEKVVYKLAEGLVRRGHTVSVLSISDQVSETTTTVLDNGVEAIYLPDRNIYWPFVTLTTKNRIKRALIKFFQRLLDLNNYRYRKDITDAISSFKPDLIHTHNLKGISVIVWRIAKKLGINIAHTIHDYSLQCHRDSRRKSERNCKTICDSCRLYSTPKRWASEGVKSVAGVSDFILESHLTDGFFPSGSSMVIYNSVDSVSHAASGKAPIDQLSNVSTPNIPKKIGYLGRLEYSKGVLNLIDNMRSLANTDEYRFIIAGAGEAAIENQLKADSSIDYRGFVDPAAFFNEIDYLIVPSLWYEPMGLVVIEAFSHGVPVMVNGSGGLLELVREGETGIATDITDHKRFETDLNTLCSWDYSQLSIKCREESLKYTDEKMLSAYETLYLEAIK
ncbi:MULTISPECIES: glycosyltransferase family 4 protein [unclassified Marinobacterium]|uniref:glycosyltransferase family 4 protein n=1 Tax=unclassified Marinobacterium TaxID=2644139 RepID=UPI0015692A6A|nr:MULTISPECIES: glycosyltransferase family 4 protein [unclassified Marinobacterium]NRP47428.1 Glycogen synthase [Marinobacterium sp. xm-d-543]NRQ23471.1 Glycogen synthase [Marinobacterium sp. xm-m-312]